MNIVICIKDNENEINSRDLSAIGFALDLASKTNGEVYGISFGKYVFDRLKECLSLGVNYSYGYETDENFDFYDSAKIISKLIGQISGVDVVIMSHGNSGAVIPSMVGEFLNFNGICGIKAFEYRDKLILTRKTESNLEKYEVKTPCVIGVKDISYEPKKPRKTVVDSVDESLIKIFNKDDLEINFNRSIEVIGECKKNSLNRGVEIFGSIDEKVDKVIEILKDNDIIR